jgi:AraC-like DNA-binding protein
MRSRPSGASILMKRSSCEATTVEVLVVVVVVLSGLRRVKSWQAWAQAATGMERAIAEPARPRIALLLVFTFADLLLPRLAATRSGAAGPDMEIVYAGRARIVRGDRECGVSRLVAGLPPGRSLHILVCEKGGAAYFHKANRLGRREAVPVRPGQGILAWRDIWIDDMIEDEYRLQGVTLWLRGATLPPFVAGVLDRNRGSLPVGQPVLPLLDGSCVARLVPHMEEMGWEFRQRQTGWRTVLRGRFDLLETELVRWAQAGLEAAHPERSGPAAVRSACAFFREEMHRRITLRDAARAAGLSPKRLIAVFGECGMPSPMAWLRELRMREARSQLCGGGLTIKEAAAAVGLSPTALRRVHRKHFGTLPSEASRPHPTMPRGAPCQPPRCIAAVRSRHPPPFG